ncbi:MAG: hypothetical protein JEY96_16750 [Bacteroidales bacterium]|nr:hypothetical protein [Bacteroidales bacterium]
MRKLLSILLLLISVSLYSQQTEFRFYIENPCNGERYIENLYVLKDSTLQNEFSPDYTDTDPVTLLPNTGIYYLYVIDLSGFGYGFDSLKVNVNKTGKFDYVHVESNINILLKSASRSLIYQECGNKLDGFQMDTFPNGNIKVCGNFKNRKVKDSLVYFYENGNVKKRLLYSKRNIRIQEFDKASNLLFLHKNSRKSYYLTDYKKTGFYLDGNVKFKERKKKHFKYLFEYYPNGNLKTKQKRSKRIEFHESGEVKLKYKRRRVNIIEDIYLGGYHTYDIEKKEFDKYGVLILDAKYQIWGNETAFNEFLMKECDWIIYLYRYENGVKIYSLEDIESIKVNE